MTVSAFLDLDYPDCSGFSCLDFFLFGLFGLFGFFNFYRKLAHTTFSTRIKGLASGTEMTGRTLHQFFHFDMPPYLVILLL